MIDKKASANPIIVLFLLSFLALAIIAYAAPVSVTERDLSTQPEEFNFIGLENINLTEEEPNLTQEPEIVKIEIPIELEEVNETEENISIEIEEPIEINLTQETNETIEEIIEPIEEVIEEPIQEIEEITETILEEPSIISDLNQNLILLKSNNSISYETDEENPNIIYPNLIFNELEIDSTNGYIILEELGALESENFITTFILDTTNLEFTQGTYRKRAEGSALYKCINFSLENKDCNQEWKLVKEINYPQEYEQEIQKEFVVYGETKQEQQRGDSFEIQNTISASQADGLVAYEQANSATPLFRTWDNTNDFSAQSTAQSLGVDGTNDITWSVLKGSHERDEMILGTIDKEPDIKVQIYTPSGGWSNLQVLAEAASDATYRSLDIAYEDLSGDALIVYENSATVDNTVAYRIWNGTAYSTEQTLTLSFTDTTTIGRWIELTPRKGTDNIMLVIHNEVGGLYAVPWDGDSFDTIRQIEASTATTSLTEQHFGFAWEESSGQGLLFYGEADLTYRTYDPVGGFGGVENTITTGAIDAVRLCSDPTSDYIGIIWQDSGDDINVRMWDGTSILASPPSQDNKIEVNGVNNANVDCAWYNQNNAVFGFIDFNQLSMDYFTFTKANTWSTADLTSTSNTGNFASDDIESIRFTQNPITAEVMAIVQDVDLYAHATRWTGSTFTAPTTSQVATATTEVLNGAQESAQFDWFRYDPMPNVTAITANISSLSLNEPIWINATVIDNLNVSTVLANVSYPNTTIAQFTLTDNDADNIYNFSFTRTGVTGTYTIRIIANDTSIHNSINLTETITFSITEIIPPDLNITSPLAKSTSNIGEIIEIAANVSDNSQVDAVLANVSMPNSTIKQLTLNYQTLDKYNNSFIAPALLGTYNITFYANDSSANSNESESTNFTVNDVVIPNITTILPAAKSSSNIGDIIEIAANITDDVQVDTVLANISHPNGTVKQITLANDSAYLTKFNNSFTAPYLIGTYNVTFYANDSSANSNESESTNFTVNDVVIPNITIISPTEGENFAQNAMFMIKVNVTDDVNISSVTANITLPNLTIKQRTLTDNTNNNQYNNTFNITDTVGAYTIRIIVNDTSNNINLTETRNFNVQDSGAPLASLVSPENNVLTTNTSINFTCNATDTNELGNITIYHNIRQTFNLNITTTVTSLVNETNFTINNIPDGTYIWNCRAEDVSKNGAFAGSNYTLNVDTTPPNVTNLIPPKNSIYSTSSIINISTIVIDNLEVSSVLANVSYPNGTVKQLTLTDQGNNIYNITYSIPALIGDYNITVIANDTLNNINLTETTNFTSLDANSLAITSLGCNRTSINLSYPIKCNATATDDIGISSVIANITLPNSTIIQKTAANISSNYHFNFTNTTLVGQYNITWWVNDTSNNQQTATDNFNVTDVISPQITLNTPLNNSNLSSADQIFNFTSTDNYYSTLNCNLTLDGQVNKTNSLTPNNTYTTFSVSSLINGSHYWNITCIDNSGNSNTSVTTNFTIDTEKPSFITLITTPNSTDTLDPNTNITAFANITDNITNINTVFLQYKLNNESGDNYTNLTMTFNAADGLYNATFNATHSQTYNLRLFANDSAGNQDLSNLVNLTIESERTWTRSPSTFDPVSASLNSNVSIGNLTINNTGDYALNFTIVSDSSNTIYNETENFTLAAGSVKIILVNDSAAAIGAKVINLEINATDGNPASQTTTGTIIVAPGQPVLSASFTTPSSDSLTVTQGDTNIPLTGKLENIGEGTVYNISFFFELPTNWNVTFGSSNVSINDLANQDETENNIEIQVPDDATVGTYTITLNSSGVNETGTNLASENLIIGRELTVNVEAPASTLGSSTGGGSSTSSSPSSSPGGSGGASGGTVTKVEGETIHTSEALTIVRGTEEGSSTSISNLYENAVLENVNLEVQGFLSQYLTIKELIDYDKLVNVETKNFILNDSKKPVLVTLKGMQDHHIIVNEIGLLSADITFKSTPQNLTLILGETTQIDTTFDNKSDIGIELKNITEDGLADIKIHRLGSPKKGKIYFQEEREYILDIFAPAYLEKDSLNLTVKITADIVAVNPLLAGFTKKTLTEYRDMVFHIIEVSPSKANFSLEQAKQDLKDMTDAKFPVTKAQNLLFHAEIALNDSNYELALKLSEQISKIRKDAFETDSIIQEVQEGIQKAEGKRLKVSETKKILSLAIKAFEREDFATAADRAKNAQLILVLETKGRLSILWFIMVYWWAILLGAAITAIAGIFIYREIMILIIKHKSRDFIREEQSLENLIQETQSKYLKEKSISSTEFHRLMAQYETRLDKVKKLKVKLRNKKFGLIKTKQGIINLKKERKEIIALMKQSQIDYLQKGKLSRHKFLEIYTADKTRLAEIEEETELFREKFAKEKTTKRYKLLSVVNNIYLDILNKSSKIKHKKTITKKKKSTKKIISTFKIPSLNLRKYFKPTTISLSIITFVLGIYLILSFILDKTINLNTRFAYNISSVYYTPIITILWVITATLILILFVLLKKPKIRRKRK